MSRPGPAAALALAAIAAYQRWLSPHKGFACAWRVHEGGASCSVLGARAIRRYGLWRGGGVLRLRLALCAGCHAEHHPAPAGPAGWARPAAGQRGSAPCDLPCDGPLDWVDCSCNLCDGCDSCDRRRSPRDRRPTRAERAEARRRAREAQQRAREGAGPPAPPR